MDEFTVIGKRLPQADAPAKSRGQANYVADLSMPGMLYGAILRSPHPHARIVNIDCSNALRLKGVRSVITGKDTRGRRYGIMPDTADEMALAIDKVRYIGEAIAAVAAADEDTAGEALELIRVEYDPLPPVLDPTDALKEGAPQVHEQAPGNISCEVNWSFGDMEAAFAQADHIREDSFWTEPVAHSSMEPHGTLASYDTGTGRLTVWASTQNLFLCRLSLSVALGLPEEHIRIIKPTVGGGFGGKVEMYAHDFAASLLSMKTGRPVKIICSRDEVFSATRYRHPMHVWLRTAVKNDGTLLARDCKIIADGGAYNSTAPVVMYLAGMIPNLHQRLPAFRYHGIRAYTNKAPAGPQRGHGIIQGAFAVESQMDLIASDLGLDPLEIRRRNATCTGYELPNQIRVNSCGLSECLDNVEAGLRRMDADPDKKPGRGLGLAASGFVSGQQIVPHLHPSAIIKIHFDGAVTLFTGAPDVGQGSNTVLAQIAAEELGVGMEQMHVVAADTELTPMDCGAYSSRITFWVGNAVKDAAARAKTQLLDVAAASLEARPGDLEARGGRISVKGSPERGMAYKQAVKLYFRQKEEPIVAHGTFHTEPGDILLHTGVGNPSPAFTFAGQIAEVQADRETGEISVLSYDASQDSGRALNPMAVEGQIEGSIIGGLGQALIERVDRADGQVMNPSFTDYHIPTALETPSCKVWHADAPDPMGPFGAKEGGEGTQVPVAAAIANAIQNALGVRITTLPITPERILEALNKEAR